MLLLKNGSFDLKYLLKTCGDLLPSVTEGGGGGTDESSSSFVSLSPRPFCIIAAMSLSKSSAVVIHLNLRSRMIISSERSNHRRSRNSVSFSVPELTDSEGGSL